VALAFDGMREWHGAHERHGTVNGYVDHERDNEFIARYLDYAVRTLDRFEFFAALRVLARMFERSAGPELCGGRRRQRKDPAADRVVDDGGGELADADRPHEQGIWIRRCRNRRGHDVRS